MVTGIVSTVLIVAGTGAFGLVVGGIGWMFGMAAVGLLLGSIYGAGVRRAGAYRMGTPRGVVAFVVDHTWSLPNTLLGALFLGLLWIGGNRIDPTFSQRYTHIGLVKPLFPPYATTIGTVMAGIGVVDKHESIHVLQARLFGPLYLPLVVANYVLATVVPYWLLVPHKAITGLGTYFTHGVYPHVWNEAWAYRIEGSPP